MAHKVFVKISRATAISTILTALIFALIIGVLPVVIITDWENNAGCYHPGDYMGDLDLTQDQFFWTMIGQIVLALVLLTITVLLFSDDWGERIKLTFITTFGCIAAFWAFGLFACVSLFLLDLARYAMVLPDPTFIWNIQTFWLGCAIRFGSVAPCIAIIISSMLITIWVADKIILPPITNLWITAKLLCQAAKRAIEEERQRSMHKFLSSLLCH